MSALRPALFHIAMAPALATASALSAVLSADGALRELGRELDDAWRVERVTAGRRGEQLRSSIEGIVLEILAARARSVDGVKVKVRAFLWAYCAGRPAIVADVPDTPDHRAVKTALRGLLAQI